MTNIFEFMNRAGIILIAFLNIYSTNSALKIMYSDTNIDVGTILASFTLFRNIYDL